MADSLPTIAVLGGTGPMGRGLGRLWAKAGYGLIVGSRDRQRAEARAREMAAGTAAGRVRGMANPDAAAAAHIAVLTVPFAHHRPVLESVKAAVQGKILVDVTVPLTPPRVGTVNLPPEGSAAEAAQAFLGDGVKVVSAFHNLAAHHLEGDSPPPDCDVLVCGDDADAREAVVALAAAAGLRGWHAGSIANSAAAEALTSVLIFINRHYGIDGAGLRITGEPGEPYRPAV